MCQQDGLALDAELAHAFLLLANLLRAIEPLFDRRDGVSLFQCFDGRCGHGSSLIAIALPSMTATTASPVAGSVADEMVWLKSNACAECVSAPIEMASTPEAAYASKFSPEIL